MKMKKDYKKPMIYFESFTLSQNIAAGCTLISEGKNAPVYDPESDVQVYLSGVCVYEAPNELDQICYDVPIAGWNVFTS